MLDETPDLKTLLSQKLGEQEVASLIEKKREEYAYLLNIDGAVYILAREMGLIGKEEKTVAAVINEIKENMTNLVLKAVIKRIYAIKEFEKNGKKGKVCRILLEDETGEIPLILWNADVSRIETGELEKGDVLTLKGVYVKEKELHLGYNSSMEITKGHTAKKINELTDREIVDLFGKVKEIRDVMNFEKELRKGKVSSLTLEDETGEIRVVLWDENADLIKKINIGDSVKIENAFYKDREVIAIKDTRIMVKPPIIISVKVNELRENEPCEISGQIKDIYLKESELEVKLDDGDSVTAIISGNLINTFLGIHTLATDINLETVVAIKKTSLIGQEIKMQGELKQNIFIPKTVTFL